MKTLVLTVLLATCEGQSTVKYSSIQAGRTCFMDEDMHEDVKV